MNKRGKSPWEPLLRILIGSRVLMALFWYFYFTGARCRLRIYRTIAAVAGIPKSQRDRITGIAFVAATLVGFLWYFGVRPEQARLRDIQRQSAIAMEKLNSAPAVKRQSKEIADKLHARGRLLAKRESFLPPERDAYAWIVSTIGSLSALHSGVKLDAYTQPEVRDVGLIPKFPYRWATFHVKGTGYYHEFGSFFADLENTFRCIRISNLVIAPNTSPGAEPETLGFYFDLVVPIIAGETK